jgi:hypothetical protein
MISNPTDIPGRVTALKADSGLPGTRSGAPVSITVHSIDEFNAWYERHTYGSTLVVGGRYETRGGQMFCLGGLSWGLHIKAIVGGPLTVSLDTAEDETLPDLPVVRAGFPYDLGRNARGAVAA